MLFSLFREQFTGLSTLREVKTLHNQKEIKKKKKPLKWILLIFLLDFRSVKKGHVQALSYGVVK